MRENDLSPYVTAMPENTVRVKLPHSEVAMHMQVAGRDRWVAASGRAAQIYSDDGQPFSFPVLFGEAGLDEHGLPQTLPRANVHSVHIVLPRRGQPQEHQARGHRGRLG